MYKLKNVGDSNGRMEEKEKKEHTSNKCRINSSKSTTSKIDNKMPIFIRTFYTSNIFYISLVSKT